MIKRLLILSGSPTANSSTDVLLSEVANACMAALTPEHEVQRRFVKLAQLRFVPCQACGEAPTPHWCFYHDLDAEYDFIADCDALIFGSPIYFDNISAQAKAFIDRCNCFRPADFQNVDPKHGFLKILPHKRPGAIVFVGGEHGWFEGARRTIVGFFKWIEITSVGMVTYTHTDLEIGTVATDSGVLRQAQELGRKLADAIRQHNATQTNS